MMALVVAFKQDKGWDKTKPALVGYWNEEGKIQLINGTHRRMAAIRANIAVPVVIHSFDFVKSMWGTEGWNDLMESGDA
jgi:NADPH-dependent ferric siderophore reductase